MHLLGSSGLRGGEVELCELADERVDAIPTPGFQPCDEEIRLFEPFEERCGVGPAEDPVAELRRHLAEHACPKEEPATLVVQRAEELLVQILGDEPVVASELANGLLRIGDAAKPEKRQVERPGPALGSVAEDLDVLGLE